MVNNYNAFNASIGRISIEPTLENATAYGGIIPLLDYSKKVRLTDHLEEHLSVSKQGGIFPLTEVSTGRIITIVILAIFVGISLSRTIKI